MKTISLALLLSLSVAFVGCGNPTTATTPAPPNSPQTQVINISKTLADAISGAVNASIALRDQGKITPDTNLLIRNWAKSAITLNESIATELGSADTWSVQKAKIYLTLTGFKTPTVSGLDPTIQADFAAIMAIVQQIQTAVSQ